MADFTGQMLGERYRVDGFLGHGGMADVYRAQDLQRAVPLALKILHGDLAGDVAFMRRFELEARTLEMLQHPNIVRCYGLEASGGLSFLVMDYIDGLTLRDEILKWKGGMSAERALEIMRPVCAALFYAHRRGMVHCDIKPANIMIHRNGTVYLTDFGIARGRGVEMEQAAPRQGTPAYIAPEQAVRMHAARRNAAGMNAASHEPAETMDVYALGVVLFEMLTGGRRPFNGSTPGAQGSSAVERVLWEKTHLPAPALRSCQPSAPEAFETVVARCLERDPARRYQNTLDLLHAMEAALRGNDDGARASTSLPPRNADGETITTLGEPMRGRRRPTRWVIAALAFAALTLAALAAPLAAPQLLAQAGGNAAALSAAATPALASPTSPARLPTATPPPAEAAALPAEAQAATASAPTPVPQPTPLGGSRWIAFASDRGGSLQIWIMDAASPENRRQITDLPGGACQPAWSPDGRQIAFTTPCSTPRQFHVGSRILLADVMSGAITDLNLPRSTFDPAWTPDGKGLIFTALVIETTELRRLNLSDRTVATLSQRGTKNAQAAVSRDGEHVVFITGDGARHDALWMVAPDGGSSELVNETTYFAEPAFTPDGLRVLASVTRGGENPYLTLMEWNNPNQPAERLLEESYAQRRASFSPDGRWIVFWSEITPAGRGEILIAPADGSASARQLTSNRQADFHPAWAPQAFAAGGQAE